MTILRLLAVGALLGLLPLTGTAWAVLPNEQLADPVLEARARAISQELRCVVCQNQSIDDSDATLAHDLRVIVREQLSAGASDEQAKAYIVARYGNYVLLRPPLQANTWGLWLGPPLFLLLGALGVALYLRRRQRGIDRAEPLGPDEQLEIERLMREGDAG